MISGKHEPGFEPLARAFESVLEHKPFGGGALTLYHQDKVVFDMWGGARDNDGNPWEARTASVSWSTTKGVAATALHIAKDRGLLQYDDPVARYWPEFAQNGKDKLTIRQVLTHSAGLYDAFSLFQHADDMLDWQKVTDALARAKPAHEPGRYHSYHALTFGHLVGEILQRVMGKSFSQIIDSEIAKPLGLNDFFVGASDEALTRAASTFKAASTRPLPSKEQLRERLRERNARMERIGRVARLFGVPMKPERARLAFNVRGVASWDFAAHRVLSACLPSVGGLFTARDLARMYAALAAGGSLGSVRLLSPETLREATRVQTRKLDGVVWLPMSWRLGYHAVFSKFGPVRGAFGHNGYNGSGGWASPRHRAALGFVVNAGAGNPLGDTRLVKLTSTALSCLRRL